MNEAKSAVDLAQRRKILGYSFWVAPGSTVKRRVAGKTLATMKQNVRFITRRTGGRSIEQVCGRLRSYLLGSDLDEWTRHRLRAIHLKHWKRGTTIYRELWARGLPQVAAARVAANGRRWWKNSGMLINIAFPIRTFDQLGVPRLAA